MPLRDFGETNVRFGSKADIHPPSADVRFTPKSGHQSFSEERAFGTC